MKKTISKWALGLGILLVLVIYDQITVKMKQAPPVPEIAVGNKQVEAEIKEYKKDETVTKFSHKKKESGYITVNPRTKIEVSFNNDPETINITEEMPTYEAGKTEEQEVVNGEVGNQSGQRTFLIHAKWKDKKEATYNLFLNVKKIVSYQRLLANEEGEYSIFYLTPNIKDPEVDKLYQNKRMFISSGHGTENLEQAKKDYPALKLKSPTTYILFNYRTEVFRAEDIKTFKDFINSFQP
jgi:hypothetical protein